MSKTIFQSKVVDSSSAVKVPQKIRISRIHWVLIGSIITAASILLSTLSTSAQANRPTQAAAISDSEQITLSLALPQIAKYNDDISLSQFENNSENKITTHQLKVKKGDTLTHIFRRAGLDAADVKQITRLGKRVKALTRIAPGQKFDISLSDSSTLEKVVYHINKTRTLTVQKEDGKFVVKNEAREYEKRVTYAKGEIDSSLFESARAAGLSDSLTMDLAYIFGWDIDFALDIRKGDSFVIMYEELFLDGEKVRDGNIIAAEFNNQGKRFKTVRYESPRSSNNYYTEDGKSMRKAFLRSPVDFTRISSRFGKRYHPILKKRKSHKGVDYAASRGTPVKASGDGKIIWRGRKGGYGKTVIVQHGSRFSTLYAHLNNYNRKARSGSKVKQGQVIGYVGSTGRATGPHLHYEFRVNGRHRNPLTVKLPNAAPIKKKYRQDFAAKTKPLIAQLGLIANTNVAMSDFQ